MCDFHPDCLHSGRPHIFVDFHTSHGSTAISVIDILCCCWYTLLYYLRVLILLLLLLLFILPTTVAANTVVHITVNVIVTFADTVPNTVTVTVTNTDTDTVRYGVV